MKYKKLEDRIIELKRDHQLTWQKLSEISTLGKTILYDAAKGRPLTLSSIEKIAKGFDAHPVLFYADELMMPESLNPSRSYVYEVLSSFDPGLRSKINSGRILNTDIDRVCMQSDIIPMYISEENPGDQFMIYFQHLKDLLDNPIPQNKLKVRKIITEDFPDLRVLGQKLYKAYFDL